MARAARAQTGQPPFKTGETYHNHAYRPRIAELRPKWNASKNDPQTIHDYEVTDSSQSAQRADTLYWMWKHDIGGIKDICNAKKDRSSPTIPQVDDGLIPPNHKRRGGRPPNALGAAAPAAPIASPVEPVAAAPLEVNTTQFQYMPQPPDNDDVDTGGLDVAFKSRTRFVKGPTLKSDENEEEWHGVEFIGQGSFGRVGLWVKTDANDTIIDVSEC